MSHPETIGAYRILGVVGEGGMGVVYRAEHRTPGVAERQGPVVLKTLHPHLARRAEFRARFEQEAEICARIEHPGVVRFIDLILDRETAALVLAYVPGEPLNEQLEAWREPQALVGLLEQLAATLDYLHTRSPNPVIHRDLKPSNVLVTPGGKPVLLDFGIARAGASTLTQTATAMGTPDYMAPEQELDAKRVDRRTDVYALGVIAFRLLTGTLPWEEGLSWSAIFFRKDRGNLDLAASKEAAHVFEHALAPSPEDRFRTASALVSALRTALIGEPRTAGAELEPLELDEPVEFEVAADPGPAPETPVPPKRRTGLLVGGGLAMLGLLVFLGVSAGADGEDCEAARTRDDVVGWERYLGEHPDGACASEARSRIGTIRQDAEEAAAEEAARERREAEEASIARAAELEARCDTAHDEDSPGSWAALLEDAPEASCAREARRRLEALEDLWPDGSGGPIEGVWEPCSFNEYERTTGRYRRWILREDMVSYTGTWVDMERDGEHGSPVSTGVPAQSSCNFRHDACGNQTVVRIPNRGEWEDSWHLKLSGSELLVSIGDGQTRYCKRADL